MTVRQLNRNFHRMWPFGPNAAGRLCPTGDYHVSYESWVEQEIIKAAGGQVGYQDILEVD